MSFHNNSKVEKKRKAWLLTIKISEALTSLQPSGGESISFGCISCRFQSYNSNFIITNSWTRNTDQATHRHENRNGIDGQQNSNMSTP